MKAYVWVAVAIVSETIGTEMLKISEGFTDITPSLGGVDSYPLSCYLVPFCLNCLPFSLAYASWAGTGTALNAIAGILIWDEAATLLKGIGILLIIAGVILLNMKDLKQRKKTA